MSRPVGIAALGIGAWLGLSSLVGCNSLLDIQEAQPRASAGGGSAVSVGVGNLPALVTGKNVCTKVNTSCGTCLATVCKDYELNTCLRSPTCRTTLDVYRLCLGTTCSPSDCFEKLFDVATEVPDCVADCKNACQQAPVYSACELYCACMGTNCASKFEDGTFKSMNDCVNECDAKPLDIQSCRRTHCEIAKRFPDEQHCLHATGFGFCSEMQVKQGTICTDKSLNSFACSADAECCSAHCDQVKRECQN